MSPTISVPSATQRRSATVARPLSTTAILRKLRASLRGSERLARRVLASGTLPDSVRLSLECDAAALGLMATGVSGYVAAAEENLERIRKRAAA